MNPQRPLEWFRRVAVALLVAPIRLYKLMLSPFLPRVCRFHPSCSVYAMGALRVHGPFKGTWLALRRLARCHPFNAGGLDPVPLKNGRPAEELLAVEDPFVATRLAEAPPPWFPPFSPSGVEGGSELEHPSTLPAEQAASKLTT